MIYRVIIFFIQLIILTSLITIIFTNPLLISLDIGNFKYTFSSNIFCNSNIWFNFITLFIFLSFFLKQDSHLINFF